MGCKPKNINMSVLGTCYVPNMGTKPDLLVLPYDYFKGVVLDSQSTTEKVVIGIPRKFKRKFFRFLQSNKDNMSLQDNNEKGATKTTYTHSATFHIRGADEFVQEQADRLSENNFVLVAFDNNKRCKILGTNAGLSVDSIVDDTANEANAGLKLVTASSNKESGSALLLRVNDYTDPLNPVLDEAATQILFESLKQTQTLPVVSITPSPVLATPTIITVASTAEMQEYLDIEGNLTVSFQGIVGSVGDTLNGITAVTPTILTSTTFSIPTDTNGLVYTSGGEVV